MEGAKDNEAVKTNIAVSSNFKNEMSSSGSRYGPLVGSIDEGTSSVRFLVFAAKTAEILTYHQKEIKQITPREGWVEQDPIEILESTKECINQTIENLKQLDIDPEDIVATGITNQRETTVVWDAETGLPLHNAIVWLDMRTAETVDKLVENVRDRNKECLKQLCGLPISTYFSATKMRWMMDNVKEVEIAVKNKKCYFGTIDSWLIWNLWEGLIPLLNPMYYCTNKVKDPYLLIEYQNGKEIVAVFEKKNQFYKLALSQLTGGKNGGTHVTDVTNASRTMLMNIKTLKWDQHLLKFFNIPEHVLPEIKSSSEIYGYMEETSLKGVPISGCLGDQQAALVGQMCFEQGQAKNTYGTGCFLLYNTGPSLVFSSHGLLTTVGYKMGADAPVIYALEGSIAVAGVAIRWLRDNLQVLKEVKDAKPLAENSHPPGDVVFVPAFSGLYAPYWRQDARSVICGVTEETTKGHIIRAALEATCFQTRDILEAMNKDCGIPLRQLLVDGGMTANDFLMQQQADLVGIPVIRPSMAETTALGAAMAAGSAQGIEVWNLKDVHAVPVDTFLPSISEDERDYKYSRWKMAIQRSLGWSITEEKKTSRWHNTLGPINFNDEGYMQETIQRSLNGILFFFIAGALLVIANRRANV